MTKKEDIAFNEFQQQKEKVSYFWIIEKKRLEVSLLGVPRWTADR